MNIAELAKRQAAADAEHGFPTCVADPRERYEQLRKDLVGLMGEIGEFANLVKKISLKIDYPPTYNLMPGNAEELLAEEIADASIYLLRISTILQIDLEKAILEKIEHNNSRYAKQR